MAARDPAIRFTCERCLALLQAPLKATGTRRRCPKCQLAVTVPYESRLPVKGETYGVHDGPLSTAQRDYIALACPVCRTRNYVTKADVGRQVTCPDCGHVTTVLPPAASETRAATASVEEYLLCEEVPGETPATEDTTIRLFCRVCGTMMYANERQVGEEMVCPDCRARTVIRRPLYGPVKTKPRSASEIGQYDLAEEKTVDEKPDALSAAGQQRFIPVVCAMCHTRLHASEEQVGDLLICPDCGKANIVPPPPRKPREIDVMAGADGGYRVSAQPTSPPLVIKRLAPVQSGRQLPPQPQRPVLPRWPLLTGTFAFPFVPGRRITIALIGWALGAQVAFAITVDLIQLGHLLALCVGAICFTAALALAASWFTFMLGCAITIVRDTANGCDRIQEWPGIAIVEWLFDPLYVIAAVCVGGFPGVIMRWFPPQSADVSVLVTAAGLFFLPPFALLSMLETGSPLGPVSWPVIRSLWQAWQGWISFYVLAAALLTLAAGLVTGLATATFNPDMPSVVILPIGTIVIAVFTWLVYFRLLGRLAWYCAEQGREEDVVGDDEGDDPIH